MWLLLIPLLLLLIVLSVILGTAAVAVAIVREVPWLLILGGIWLIWRGQRKRRRRRDWRYEDAHPRDVVIDHAPPRVVSPPTPVEPEPARELPIDVRVKVEQIQRKADVLLGYADRFPPFSQDLHIVKQTTAEYLPRTIDAYLALPVATDEAFTLSTSEQALRELRAQLQLLDTKLDEIAGDLQRHDLDRLLANRRFLEERFRTRPEEPQNDAVPDQIRAGQ